MWQFTRRPFGGPSPQLALPPALPTHPHPHPPNPALIYASGPLLSAPNQTFLEAPVERYASMAVMAAMAAAKAVAARVTAAVPTVPGR